MYGIDSLTDTKMYLKQDVTNIARMLKIKVNSTWNKIHKVLPQQVDSDFVILEEKRIYRVIWPLQDVYISSA